MLRLLLYKTLTVKSHKRHRKLLAATSSCYCKQRGYAKHRLAKFKGIKKENFLLHLKECVLLAATSKAK